MRVGAIEHGDTWWFGLVPGLANIFLDVIGDEERFALAVQSFVIANLRATIAGSPQRFSFALQVVRDDGARRLQNHLRGAIVLFQSNDFGAREIFFKIKNVANIGAAPGINALIFIADDADILLLARQHLHQFVLGTVGVLIFIDQYVAESTVVVAADRRHRAQQANGFQQQIIEVERVGPLQFLVVEVIEMGDAFRLRI